MSYDARPFVPERINSGEGGNAQGAGTSSGTNDHLSLHQQQLGERLYPKVRTFLFLIIFVFALFIAECCKISINSLLLIFKVVYINIAVHMQPVPIVNQVKLPLVE